MILEKIIDQLYETPDSKIKIEDAIDAITQLKDLLNSGKVRAAEFTSGCWKVNVWVKKGILLGFRVGKIKKFASVNGFQFFDKDTMSLKELTIDNGVRVVPGGSAIRDGVYIGKGVIVMPPSYINIGAYIGEKTMIDSHVLIGSCAQIGSRVHVSAGTQIGGVLEPPGSFPVIIEDEVFIGGNCGIYEGTIVGKRAVIGAGVVLTASTPIYDLINNAIYKRSQEGTLVVPENAVVVPGSRLLQHPFAREHHLSVNTPIIIKYRDEKTNAVTALEDLLR